MILAVVADGNTQITAVGERLAHQGSIEKPDRHRR